MTGFDAVWINGSVGTGKTTVADRLGRQLEGRGVPGAVVDVDELRRAWPAPADDPFRGALAIANLTAVARTFRAHGAQAIIAAGVIEEQNDVPRHAEALAAERMLHVMLTLDPAVAAARLRARHGADELDREWHLRRHPQLARILEAAGFADVLTIDTTALAPDEVARRIAEAL